MVKNILQLFLVCSLFLQAQSARIDVTTSQKNTHSAKSIGPNASSTATITSLSYTIRPLSTIYSSLPSDLYISHTFIPESKVKRALPETSSTTQTSPTPKINSSESSVTGTSNVASNSLPTISATPSEKALSPTTFSTTSTTESNPIAQDVVINNIKSTIQTTPASLSIDSTKTTSAVSSNSSLTPLTATPITVTTASTSEISTKPSSVPTFTTTSSVNFSEAEVDKGLSSSVQSTSSSTEIYAIPTFRPIINEEILRAIPSKSLTLQRPILPSHSETHENNKHSSAILRPVSSNAPIHAAQNQDQQSLLSLIPSILNPPQQTEQQISSSINEPPTVTDMVAQQVTDSTTNGTQHVFTTVIAKEVPNPEAHIKSCYRRGRKVEFSQYWIPKENEWDETNRGRRVFLGGDAKMKLYDRFDQEIGQVPIDMYQKCRMEGTCLLENGDLINIESNDTDTFIKIGGPGRKENVFGLGSGPQNLVPFVSVAANDIPYGQKLYISALDGVDLGNGIKHNGCVRVDDESWSFDSCQIDFFVLTYVDYLWLDLDTKVSIKYADCKLKNYVTRHHLAFVKASTDRKIIPNLLDAKSTFFINRNQL